jgi:hypothetical protein
VSNEHGGRGRGPEVPEMLVLVSIFYGWQGQIAPSHQSALQLAFRQDRDISGKSRTQDDLSRNLDRRMLPGCSQQQGAIDHV